MKYFFCLIFYFCLTISFVAQNSNPKISRSFLDNLSSKPSNERVLVWIYLKDKENYNSKDRINSFSSVSERSLMRRSKVNLGCNLLDYSDIPINSEYIRSLKSIGVKVKQKSKWLNAVSCFVTKSALEKIANLSFVKKITTVKILKHKNDFATVDKSLNKSLMSTTNLDAHLYDYGSSLIQNEIINTALVHDQGYSGKGVLICLMDAGFDQLSHTAFSSMNIVATWDFVNNDQDVEDGSDLGSGSHGTGTLSLIGGFDEGKLIGTAFGADYLLAKTENTTSETTLEEDNWVAAAEWADSIGADVFSTSLGYLNFDGTIDDYTYEDMDGNTAIITIAADLAVGKGIVVFNSAGNEYSNPTHNTLIAPADGDSVITVGSVDASGSRSSFSSVGPTFDGRIKPDFMAMGSGTYAAGNSHDNYYRSFTGTSAACPLAAGVAALLLEKNYSLTPIEIREILRKTSDNSSSPNSFYGWGIIDAHAAMAEIPEVKLNLTLLLEGPFDTLTHEMIIDPRVIVPTTSPYLENARRIEELPSDIVDWVLIELRESENGPSIAYKSALLRKDGKIVGDDGISENIVLNAEPGEYYIVVKHRNHLPIMSSVPLNLTTN
jgi:subtilisin family serine protease